MKLRSNHATTSFTVIDHQRGDTTWADQEEYLTAMHLVKEAYRNGQGVAEKTEVSCSLNGRPRSYLIYSEVDLSKVEYPFYERPDWTMPLMTPLE